MKIVEEGMHLITKPLNPSDLFQKIRTVLDS